jgi:hypothetical protein
VFQCWSLEGPGDGVEGLVNGPAPTTRVLGVVDALGVEKAAQGLGHARAPDHPRRDEALAQMRVEQRAAVLPEGSLVTSIARNGEVLTPSGDVVLGR